MNKNCTTLILNRRFNIVGGNNYYVIGSIFSPQLFIVNIMRLKITNFYILVIPVTFNIIAPSTIFRDFINFKNIFFLKLWFKNFVGSVKDFFQIPIANRCGFITLNFFLQPSQDHFHLFDMEKIDYLLLGNISY